MNFIGGMKMDSGKILLPVLALLGLVVLSQGVFAEGGVPKIVSEEAPVPEPIVGGDADEHGCIGSAGYVWCPELGKCVRPWEETCESWEKEREAQEPLRPTEPVACTEEAKVCDDGVTAVARNPHNNCEFDPCPGEEATVPNNPDGLIGVTGNPTGTIGVTGAQANAPAEPANPVAAFFNAIISFFAGFFG